MSLRGLRRPSSAFAFALALLVAVLAGAAGASTRAEVVYRGTMKITVAYWDVDCPIRDTKLRLQKTRTYRMPVG